MGLVVVAGEGIVVVAAGGFDHFEDRGRRIHQTVGVVSVLKSKGSKRTIISIDDLVDRESRRNSVGRQRIIHKVFLRSRTTRGSLVYIRHCFHQEKLGSDKVRNKLVCEDGTYGQDCGILMSPPRGCLNGVVDGEILHL